MDSLDSGDWGRESIRWAALTAGTGADGDNPLSPIYGPLIRARVDNRPFVIGQVGQSLDGRVATDGGRAEIVNGAAALIHLHRLRSLVDAVLIGVGTALADDPQLTVRDALGTDPARVILDPGGRLPIDARCLKADGARRIIVGVGPKVSDMSVEVLSIPTTAGELAPEKILSALRTAGLNRVLIEGGPRTLSRFLSARCLDRLHILTAPIIIGSGVSSVQLPAIAAIDSALRPRTFVHPLPSGDVLFDCAFDREAS
jgi:riboflavin-specific deaminase-like protein